MGSSLAGRPENRSCARLWMKKLNLVATLPRLVSINLQGSQTKHNHNTLEKVQNVCVSWRVPLMCSPGKEDGGISICAVRLQSVKNVFQILRAAQLGKA